MLLVMLSYLNGTLKGSHAQANARLWLGQPVATACGSSIADDEGSMRYRAKATQQSTSISGTQMRTGADTRADKDDLRFSVS
jgi:hypothetical protein